MHNGRWVSYAELEVIAQLEAEVKSEQAERKAQAKRDAEMMEQKPSQDRLAALVAKFK